MSADNYIEINRDTFEVVMRDVDTDVALGKTWKAKTLEKAVDIAEKIEKGLWKENIWLEYGIRFVREEKK